MGGEGEAERIPDPDNCQITVCVGFVASARKTPGFPLPSTVGENMSHPSLRNGALGREVAMLDTWFSGGDGGEGS